MMKTIFQACVVCAVLLTVACKSSSTKEANTLFKKMDADSTGIHFTNTITDNEQFNIFSYRNFYNGGGVAIGDINNDSLPDVFFTANMGPNKLYLNKGNMHFEDISEKAGITETNKWSTGVVMADVNADGWLDIYVCNAGYEKGRNTNNALFINNKNGTFTDSATAYGLDNDGYTTHAAFFDYDLDGDLDCYILNNSFMPVNTLNNSNRRDLRAKDWPVKDQFKGGGSYLMRNDGGRFTDVSEAANIYGSLISFGLGVTVGDVNGDHYPDIYVSNDFYERDYLYINQQNGTFHEELEDWTEHISQSSMGADLADVNNDGYPDIFVTDMLPGDDQRLKTTTSFENYDVYNLKLNLGFYHQYMQNTLQINNRNGKFTDVAHYSGVAATDWSWGGLIFDADNDGFSDLYVCNGITRDLTDQDFIDFFANDVIQRMVQTGSKDKVQEVIDKMPGRPQKNKAFRNTGNLRFEDAGDTWGFSDPSFSNGAAYGDLDNDGDLDLIVSNVNAQAFVYQNNSRQQNQQQYISFALQGKGKNTFAVGSSIQVFQGDQIISREIIPSRGFQSSIDYKAVMGLGNKAADSVHIIWPDKTFTRIIQPAANRTHHISWPDDAPAYIPPARKLPPPVLQAVGTNFDKHQEDNYVDFYIERNMPIMQSKEGPRAAVADVNGDGKQDVYIGGAAGQAGQLYINNGATFTKSKQPAFELMAQFEDVATLFFDADKDGDQDLMVGSGGNHLQAGIREMQNRLYLNDGKGNFTLKADALPPNDGNTSSIVVLDVDNDNNPDVFVGSKCAPQNVGAPTRHYLLRNTGNATFTDVTTEYFPQAATLGFVSAASVGDINGDGKPELITVGEFSSVNAFSFTNGKASVVNTGLEQQFGYWQSMAIADVDGDNDLDLVLGNMGENGYLKPSATAPMKLWFGDFDNNQLYDKILTRTVNGKDVPVFLKRDLTDQMPSLKKQNLRFETFATKSVQELFSPEQLAKGKQYTCNYAQSAVAINNGSGKFALQALPMQVQLSSVHAICVSDVNGDSFPDIIMGGNQYATMPQFGRFDASFGHVLINNGKGAFTWIEPAISGIQIRGAIKDIQPIAGKTMQYLVLRNNDTPVMIQRNNKPAKN